MGAPVKTGIYEEWHWRGNRHTSTWTGTLLDARDNLAGWCGKGKQHLHLSRSAAFACAREALTAYQQRQQRGRR